MLREQRTGWKPMLPFDKIKCHGVLAGINTKNLSDGVLWRWKRNELKCISHRSNFLFGLRIIDLIQAILFQFSPLPIPGSLKIHLSHW